MKEINRRSFLKSTAYIAAAGALVTPLTACKEVFVNTKSSGDKKITLKFHHLLLDLGEVFTISGFSRDTTPTTFVEITYDGVTGYGEGALPPYMIGQTPETSAKFLEQIDLSKFSSPFELEDILDYVDKLDPEHHSCSKTAVDIALHDLVGKLTNRPIHQLLGYSGDRPIDTFYTLGIDDEESVKASAKDAATKFNALKVKLGVDEETDKMLIRAVRSITDKAIMVDVNQGWRDKHYALEMIHWLSDKNVLFVEQPMPKDIYDEMAWVTERSPLPTVGDESCQRLVDVPKLHGVFNGINIKLIKSTGLREASKMIATADALGMSLMIGCTSESSLGIAAAAQLSAKMQYADLDGNIGIVNDPFKGMDVVDGKVILNKLPGVGAVKI